MSLIRPPSPAKLFLTAGVVLLVTGIGVAASFLKDPLESAHSGRTAPNAQPSVGPDSAELARLKNYTRSINTKEQSTKPLSRKPLPDVNTMIDQLAARLKTAPNDTEGWRMLGWSYFNMERYEQAATAYAKAVELDPKSNDLKRAYKMAKAKASESESSAASPSGQTAAADTSSKEQIVEKDSAHKTKSQRENDPAIRSMVDGLAKRLASSPRDVTGWTRLMRSRVVLGEKTVAVTAFREALDIFKDDSDASSKITAAAIDLGLKTE